MEYITILTCRGIKRITIKDGYLMPIVRIRGRI